MDRDRLAGGARAFAGTVEEQAGRLAGDPGLESEGYARHAAGRTQAAFGQAKDSLRGTADMVGAYAEDAYNRGRQSAEAGAREFSTRVEANPVVAILIAGAVGYLVGIIAGRRR